MGPWFGRKRVGLGARPVTWQGWLVTVLFLAGAAADARLLAPKDTVLFVVTLVALIAVYLLVVWTTYGG